MAIWNQCMSLIIFLAKSILLKHYENGNKNFFSYHDPGSAKSRIYAGKSTKRGFFQKGLTRFQKFISIWVPVNSQQDWRGKLESAYSLMVHYCKNIVCTRSMHCAIFSYQLFQCFSAEFPATSSKELCNASFFLQ